MIRGLPYALGAALLLIAGAVRVSAGGADGWPLLVLGSVLLGSWIVLAANGGDRRKDEE